MIYWTNNNISSARFGNHLYYILQMYIRTKESGILNKFIYRNQSYNSSFLILGLSKYVELCSDNKISSQETGYFQDINCHYTKQNVLDFISENIEPKLKLYNKSCEKDDVCCVHIRCGDYNIRRITRKLYDIDRSKYLNNCIDLYDFKEYHIFSDDIHFCKNNYDQIFKQKNKIVKYISQNNVLKDFISMCFYKNKIIWNSTFSCWSAYISNFLYGDNGCVIMAPDFFFKNENEGKPIQYFDNWIQVESRL